MHALTTNQCGAFCFCIVDLRTHDVCTTHALTTNQCGAFHVCNVNFCARDICTTYVSTTDLCGARSGSPQLVQTISSEEIVSSDVQHDILYILPILIIANQMCHDMIMIMICNMSPV